MNRFTFLIGLKNDYCNFKAINFSSFTHNHSHAHPPTDTNRHTHKSTISALSPWILFYIALALFQNFLLNQTNIARISFWFLEKNVSTIYFLYLLLLSRGPQGKSFLSSSVYVKTEMIRYSKKDILQNKQNFYFVRIP